jgi:hypothetical protein
MVTALAKMNLSSVEKAAVHLHSCSGAETAEARYVDESHPMYPGGDGA